MQPWHSQDRHVVRLDWGPTAAEGLTTYAVAAGSPVCAVVVDVLSFTTCVSVALDGGTTVHPYPWKDDSAEAFAAARGATLAVPRSRSRHGGGVSLSPSSIRAAGPLRDLVLPSPNGSTIAARLAGRSPRGSSAGSARRSERARRRPWSWCRPGSAGPTARCGPPSRTSGAPARSSPPSPHGSSTVPARCC